MLPWLAGIVPFGLIIGVSAARADLPTLAGWLTGPTIYGGSAQIAAIELLDVGAAPAVVLLTVRIINLRLVFYSGAIAGHWRDTGLRWRLTAAYLLVDPSFVVGMDGYQRVGDRWAAHRYYLGGPLVLWTAWLLAIGAGAAFGTQPPESLQLEFVIPHYLVGEVVRRLHDPAARRSAATAAVAAAAAVAVPLHLGVLLGIVAGLVAGATVKERTP